MRPEERADAELAVRRMVVEKGYEVLRLTISNDRHLCLTLDADPGPITMDDVTWMNWRVREALERAGLSVDNYQVEVQSPGVRRPLLTLRHFERFTGERVKVRFKEPRPDNSRVVVGVIDGIAGERVRLRGPKGAVLTFGVPEISEASLDPLDPT